MIIKQKYILLKFISIYKNLCMCVRIHEYNVFTYVSTNTNTHTLENILIPHTYVSSQRQWTGIIVHYLTFNISTILFRFENIIVLKRIHLHVRNVW